MSSRGRTVAASEHVLGHFRSAGWGGRHLSLRLGGMPFFVRRVQRISNAQLKSSVGFQNFHKVQRGGRSARDEIPRESRRRPPGRQQVPHGRRHCCETIFANPEIMWPKRDRGRLVARHRRRRLALGRCVQRTGPERLGGVLWPAPNLGGFVRRFLRRENSAPRARSKQFIPLAASGNYECKCKIVVEHIVLRARTVRHTVYAVALGFRSGHSCKDFVTIV